MPHKTRKELFLLLPAVCGFGLLIINGEVAAAAAQAGLESCLHAVIPALFPFLVLTNLLLRLEIPEIVMRPLGKVFESLFRIRRTALTAFLAGLLGGYPLGAVSAAECCRLKLCTGEEAERLLVFANNCSPAFLFGIVSVRVSGGKTTALLLLAMQWLISVCIGILLGVGKTASQAGNSESPEMPSFFSRFTLSVRNGGHTTLLICAYVVFFRVLSSFLPGNALLVGSLELTSGILQLPAGAQSIVIAAFLIGWGGLSVACQVFSALEGSGLSARRYLPLRLLHGALMAIGAYLLHFSVLYLLIFALLLLGVVIIVKICGNRAILEI